MEMMIILTLLVIILSGICVWLIWKLHRQKNDIYEFNRNLEQCLDELISEKEIPIPDARQDSLWNKIYDKLYRLSKINYRKNMEVNAEKNQIKELISDISHQTKTPIANIKLYLEILQNDSEVNASEFLSKMNGQIEKLDFLLQSMVKMSRLETGVIEVHPVKIPVIDTLATAVSDVVSYADKKNIELHVDCDENIMLSHDKKWTAEAIFNLLDNAVKYTNHNGKIYISVKEQEMFIRISVKDTGKGIAPDRQAAIFSRFYREPEIHDMDGIGVGLYLARKIIALQNGYIEVVSEVGKGADFRIYLPR